MRFDNDDDDDELDDDDYLDELYEAYRKGLTTASPIEVSRDELCDIYDRATDSLDGFVQWGALAEAMRRFPRDREIRERLAYYFWERDDMSAAEEVTRALPDNSFIKNLLSLQLHNVTPDKARRQLDILLGRSRKGSLEDEEVIRLVEYCQDNDLYDWLERSYDTLKQCARYPDTAMREVAAAASEGHRGKLAVCALEDLTQASPFETGVWTKLCDIYMEELNDPKMAENALAYALAIQPDDFDLNMRLITLRHALGRSDEETLRELEEMSVKNPDQSAPWWYRGAIYINQGDKANARRVLTEATSKLPQEVRLAGIALLADPDMLSGEQLQKRFGAIWDDRMRFEWVDQFESTFEKEAWRAATKIGRLIVDNEQIDNIPINLVEKIALSAYRSGDYESVYTLLLKFMDTQASQVTTLLLAIYALSLYRIGRRKELASFIKAVHNDMKDADTISQVERLGLVSILTRLERWLDGEDVPEWAIDPFKSQSEDI